jgi:hypothetical protein
MVKINQGYKHRNFQCQRCSAFFHKQEHLDVHMEIVHKAPSVLVPKVQKVVLDDTPAKRIKNNRKASVKVSNRQLKEE